MFEVKHIPAPKKYITDIEEWSEDVPDNVYIDKTTCGCGFTTAILRNDVNYVIAVPFSALANNKVEQSKYSDFYPHELFAFNSSIEEPRAKLQEYLSRNIDKVKKILVTYDSVPTLAEYLDPKDFKLFVDEGHKLVEFAGSFKPEVILRLEQELYRYRAFVIATATPTREEYLPEFLAKMNKIKLDWDTAELVSVGHRRVSNSEINNVAISLCLSKIKNPSNPNLYIFCNSVKFIINVCKKLLKWGVSKDDIKVITANSENNVKALKTLGKSWKIGTAHDDKYYPINFITSTAFEGQDFMDPDGEAWVISDGKLEFTKLDISTQIAQIAGRLLISEHKDRINLLWSESIVDGAETEEEYGKELEVKKEEANLVLDDFNKLLSSEKTLFQIR